MNHKTPLLLVVLLGAITAGAIAQSRMPQNPPDTVEEQFALQKAQRKAQMLEEWKGSDAPYVAIQRQIDRAVAAGQTPQTLARISKLAAQAKSRDPQAQFRCAYAAWKGSDAVSAGIDRPLLEGVAHSL